MFLGGMSLQHRGTKSTEIVCVPLQKKLIPILQRREAGVGFFQPETRAYHRVLAGVVPILDVGRCDDRAVGQQLQARIAAVASRITVQELDAVLARAALPDVVVRADPRHEMAAGRRSAGPGRGRRSPAGRPSHNAHVPVAASVPTACRRRRSRSAPSSRLNIIRLRPLWVFSRIRQQSSPPSGERNTRARRGSCPATLATTRGSDQVNPPSARDGLQHLQRGCGPRLPARGDTCPR